MIYEWPPEFAVKAPDLYWVAKHGISLVDYSKSSRGLRRRCALKTEDIFSCDKLDSLYFTVWSNVPDRAWEFKILDDHIGHDVDLKSSVKTVGAT